MPNKSVLSFVVVALLSLLMGCAQLESLRPQQGAAPAQPSQQELDSREYRMLRSSVLNQVSAINHAHSLAWYAVHDAGGIRHHAGCHKLPPALLGSPYYEQFSQLMTMEYRGRCVTEVTVVLTRGNQPKAVKK